MSKRGWNVAWLVFGVAALAGHAGCGSESNPLPLGGGPGGGSTACQKSNQCPSDQGCVGGVCAPCSQASHCMPGQSCANGACGPCTSNAQCPAGEACVNGACGGCTSNAQCTGGKVCNLGQCGPCTANAQCGAGQVCLDGKCACTTDAQCPSGLQCVSGVCTDPRTDAGVTDAGVDAPIVDSGVDAPDACAGKPIFKNVFPNVPPIWSLNGKLGTAAGDDMCKVVGADHFCTYAEIRAAQAKGELTDLANMTFWVHRDTPELVNGVMNSGGAGARCNDWRYGTNDANNGEYGTINNKIITYELAPANKLVANASGSAGSTRFCGANAGGGFAGTRNILCCAPRCP